MGVYDVATKEHEITSSDPAIQVCCAGSDSSSEQRCKHCVVDFLYISFPNRILLYRSTERYITMRYLLNKPRVGIEKHHMEVLDRVYRLQRLPILEPNDLQLD